MFRIRSYILGMVIWAFGAVANQGFASVQCPEPAHTHTYQAVERLLNEADEASRKMDNQRALVLLDAGIAQLGPHYVNVCTLDGSCIDDDTGQKLTMGNYHETEGRLWFAYNLKSGALASRLSMYRDHYSCR